MCSDSALGERTEQVIRWNVLNKPAIQSVGNGRDGGFCRACMHASWTNGLCCQTSSFEKSSLRLEDGTRMEKQIAKAQVLSPSSILGNRHFKLLLSGGESFEWMLSEGNCPQMYANVLMAICLNFSVSCDSYWDLRRLEAVRSQRSVLGRPRRSIRVGLEFPQHAQSSGTFFMFTVADCNCSSQLYIH